MIVLETLLDCQEPRMMTDDATAGWTPTLEFCGSFLWLLQVPPSDQEQTGILTRIPQCAYMGRNLQVPLRKRKIVILFYFKEVF